MSSESEYSACSDDDGKSKGVKERRVAHEREVDLGSDDSMDDMNSDEDYYVDDETGAHMTADQLVSKEKEAFEELHRLLYGDGHSRGMFSSRMKPVRDSDSGRKKRPADSEEEEPPRKKRALSSAVKPKKKAAAKPKKTAGSRSKGKSKAGDL
jgi:hypothetical protein